MKGKISDNPNESHAVLKPNTIPLNIGICNTPQSNDNPLLIDLS